HMSNFCHPDDLVLAYAELEKILKTGKPSDRFIMRFKRKNGTFYYGEQRSGVLYKKGKIVSMICNMHDISQTKEMQDKIRESKEMLQTIFDTTPYIIFIKDINNKFLKINKAGANFFNLPIKKILGKTCYDLFPPETAKTLIAEEKVVLTQGKTLNSETKIKSDKGIRIVDSIKTPIRSEQGKVTGFLAILRDVTEFKKLQEESIHKKILEEAGKITGNVAHDFNNVLAAISGYSTLVLEELGDKNPVRMEMEAIKKAVSRAVKITDTLQRKPPYKK
ncbi:MAG: PAS domain S-box protein, partial [Elusimicrobiales bacterium]|nr:PAS domain S-box protein [Elusimicrobiales bacterium]